MTRWSALAMTVAIGFVPSGAGAIIRRHDRKDSRYVQLATDYPAVCRVGRDGVGVLIHPRWVLTAAHVASSLPHSAASVRIGDEEIGVSHIVIHPEGKTQAGRPPEVDLALLELERPVPGIEPVEIYRGKDELGKFITVVGYGDTGDGRSGPNKIDGKMRAATNVIMDAGPKRLFFTFDPPPEGSDLEGVSGPGDSGGPALFEEDGKVYTVGVSHASANGRPGRYGVTEIYVRVSSYTEWILDVISSE